MKRFPYDLAVSYHCNIVRWIREKDHDALFASLPRPNPFAPSRLNNKLWIEAETHVLFESTLLCIRWEKIIFDFIRVRPPAMFPRTRSSRDVQGRRQRQGQTRVHFASPCCTVFSHCLDGLLQIVTFYPPGDFAIWHLRGVDVSG